MKYKSMKLIVSIFFIIFNVVIAQSMQDLQRLKTEYERQLKDQNSRPSEINTMNEIDIESSPSRANVSFFRPERAILDSIKAISKFYGYDFFTKKDTTTFWENLPTPKNYLLGPGDELIITLWGATQFRQKYLINREGKIYDEKVGTLVMTGRSIEAAEDYIKNQFGRIYSTIKGANPTTYLDISLGKLRSINISLVGEVNYPGIYPVHPFSTLITGLIQAGGIDTSGTLRKIKVKRSNTKNNTIDLYDYFISGNTQKNIQLRNNDVIIVSPRNSTIFIDSAVYRPGIYESLAGESVKDMIAYAGGLKHNASGTVLIKRSDNKKNLYLNHEESSSIMTNNGDRIVLSTKINSKMQVEIIGAVSRPGAYSFQRGMKILDLLSLSEEYNDSSFWHSVKMEKAQLVRRNPLLNYEDVINVNLKEIINGNANYNFNLKNLDRLIVYSNPNYNEKKNIKIEGEVNIPGDYPISMDNEELNSIILRAGGLTSKALKDGISIYRSSSNYESNEFTLDPDNLQNNVENNLENSLENNGKMIRVAWNDDKIIIMPGDSIVVKKSSRTINVQGEVYNPGLIEYKKGRSAKYYINLAGGLTELGNDQGIIIIYANGMVKPYKWYNRPRINDGSTIIVNTKETIDPFDLTQFATNWTSIISSMLTAIVLSQQLGSN